MKESRFLGLLGPGMIKTGRNMFCLVMESSRQLCSSELLRVFRGETPEEHRERQTRRDPGKNAQEKRAFK